MRRRMLLLLVVPLLAACGGDDDGDGGVDDGGAASGELSVEVSYDEPLRVGPVTWTVTVENGTDDDVELEFSSGQRADVTLSQDGDDIYRWSRALSFTQVLGTEVVPAGDELAFTLEEPGLDVDPGEYTLTATVTASNRDLSTTRQVTVEPLQR